MGTRKYYSLYNQWFSFVYLVLKRDIKSHHDLRDGSAKQPKN
nr:MAG TPA: hypothetical protein [Caudoviricetes sp.]DAX21433.1 MAG TPA: hypothetical protein [Caudoviricetes sp.]